MTDLRMEQANTDAPEAKPVSASRTIITELMIPSYANFGGKIHGGILMSLMDKAAYACASRHAGNYCVTVSVDSIDFLQPVEVGDLVRLKASVNYVRRSSLVVGIRVVSEHVQTGEKKHTNTSYFTMVAKDEKGDPALVPPLVLETQEDIRRFVTAAVRKKLKTQLRQRMLDYREEFTVDDRARQVLEDERCEVMLTEPGPD